MALQLFSSQECIICVRTAICCSFQASQIHLAADVSNHFVASAGMQLQTPLMMAQQFRHADIAAMLIQTGST